jgi:hypothetical protein
MPTTVTGGPLRDAGAVLRERFRVIVQPGRRSDVDASSCCTHGAATP